MSGKPRSGWGFWVRNRLMLDAVIRDPEVMHENAGLPRGTRVPVQALLNYLERALSPFAPRCRQASNFFRSCQLPNNRLTLPRRCETVEAVTLP